MAFVDFRLLIIMRCVMLVVYDWLLFVGRCVLRVCWLLFVVCCLLRSLCFVDRFVLIEVCRLVRVVVCCLLMYVCMILVVVH